MRGDDITRVVQRREDGKKKEKVDKGVKRGLWEMLYDWEDCSVGGGREVGAKRTTPHNIREMRM